MKVEIRDDGVETPRVPSVHPQDDVGDALQDLSPAQLAALLQHASDEALAELVAELHPRDAARLIGKLSRARAADLLEEMAPDDAADVVGALAPAAAAAILAEMQPGEAGDVRDLLAYDPATAGGLMTPEYVAVGPDLDVEGALTAVRRAADEAETVYYVYVVEPGSGSLIGVLSLRSLLLAPPSAGVGEVMVREPVAVRVDADREVAARLLDEHHLLALPVVDGEDRLLGIITADDAAEVLLDEAGEDIERLGGAQPLEEPYLRASVGHLFRKRVVWLLALFAAEAYTGSVLRHFEQTMSEMVSLAFFIPLLIGTGGNTGSQTVTTLVRAMGVGELRFGDIFRVLRRELAVGALLGLVMAAATYVRAWTLGVGQEVGPVVAVASLCIVLWAACVAAVLPLLLRRLRVDPAVVSAPFISTLVDGTGLFIYFTVARLMLHLR